MSASKDGRHWETWMSSSRKGLQGIRRIASCKGSHVCEYGCNIEGKPNNVQFKRVTGSHVCSFCGRTASRMACAGVKVWEHDGNSLLLVMYNGDHTCTPKQRRASKQEIQQAIRQNPNLPPTQMVVQKMSEQMSGMSAINWDAVYEIAHKFVDVKEVQREKSRIKEADLPLGHNFDAVVSLKQLCDKRDRFFIFKMNNGLMNGMPTYVFKSSRYLASIMRSMDRSNADSEWQYSHVHMDTKHNRVRNMKTVTMWVEHPKFRNMICLATMDIDKENTESLISFWELINTMLVDLDGKEEKFNPHGWCVDEHPANWASIQNVFGEDSCSRVVSCEFHYHQSLKKHANKVQLKRREEFKRLGKGMLTALTVNGYHEAYAKMKEFVAIEEQSLHHWLAWWHKRRYHVMHAFKPIDAPAANKAEIGHAKMANSACDNMFLIEACRIDIAEAIRTEEDLKAKATGAAPLGRGQMAVEKQRRIYNQQMRVAKECGEEVAAAAPKQKRMSPAGKSFSLACNAYNEIGTFFQIRCKKDD